MMHLLIRGMSFLLLALAFIPAAAGEGYHIDVKVRDFTGDEIYLAYYLGSSQYVQDTAHRQGDHFIFEGDEDLPGGLYLLVFPPNNRFLQIALDEDQQKIDLDISADSMQRPQKISGSEECDIFFAYVDFLSTRRPQADSLRKLIEHVSDAGEKSALQEQIDKINTEVSSYQAGVINKAPESLTALMIRASSDVAAPQFTGTDEEQQRQLLAYYQRHFFDNVPMKDPRLIRTPFLHEKVDYYINKLTAQIPDSLNKSVDFILSQFDPDGEAFKYYLVYFLNTYAKSKIVGMDAVYVHIVEEYYMKGLAPWTDGEQLNKIVKNATTLRPILIGEIAPNLVMQDRSGAIRRLHDVPAAFTVLFFWDPDCGHCKKSIPKLIDFYNNYHSRGIEVFAVCTKLTDDVPECWEAVDDRGMGIWVNVVDPYLRSRFKQIYDVRSTPQIFVLDSDKRIKMKKISAEQLPQVMDHLLSEEEHTR